VDRDGLEARLPMQLDCCRRAKGAWSLGDDAVIAQVVAGMIALIA